MVWVENVQSDFSGTRLNETGRLPRTKRTVTSPVHSSDAGKRDEPVTLPLVVNVNGFFESRCGAVLAVTCGTGRGDGWVMNDWSAPVDTTELP